MAVLARSARKVYSMLGSLEVWQTARRCHEALQASQIPHALVGGLAVLLHGYQRNTVDVDILIRAQDQAQVKQAFKQAGFRWDPKQREFIGAEDVPVHMLVSGESASDDRSLQIRLPQPDEKEVSLTLDGLSVVALPRLIELKIASGLGNLRRTHRDFADVVELILVHNLSRQFARQLHKAVRPAFRALVLQARGRKR
jgi:hypothetical protein